MDITEAVKLVTKKIREDADLKLGYRANIAMAFFDECTDAVGFENVSIDELHGAANRAADRFLDNWCSAVEDKELTATDALFGFGAWLTTRKEAVTFSHKHSSAGKMAELIDEFLKVNNLPDCSTGYPDNFKMPNE